MYTGVLVNRFIYIRYEIASNKLFLYMYVCTAGAEVYAWFSLERSTFSSRAVN